LATRFKETLPSSPQRLKTVFTIFENIYFLNDQKKASKKTSQNFMIFFTVLEINLKKKPKLKKKQKKISPKKRLPGTTGADFFFVS
jgi:hypothetical protein